MRGADLFEKGLGAFFLLAIGGVFGNGNLAAVAFVSNEVASGEDANAHEPHVLPGTMLGKAIEVRGIPAVGDGFDGGRVEGVDVDLGDIEATAVDHNLERRGLTQRRHANMIDETLATEIIEDIGDALLFEDLVRVKLARAAADRLAVDDSVVQDQQLDLVEPEPLQTGLKRATDLTGYITGRLVKTELG